MPDRRRGLPLTPAQRLERLRHRIPQILENAKAAKKLGYSKVDTRDEHERQNHLGHSDPTGSVVVGQERTRLAVEEGERQLLAACDALDRADNAYLVALRLSDNRRPLTGDQPKIISDDEFREARAAKQRRERRGEGHG
jgi:hypothetical protein